VIAIIALLAGAIVGGKSLVRAAELRSVMTDANQYLTAIKQFRSQYTYLPGDLPTASGYWTTASNGNADGMIMGDERFGVFQQLNLAGFVETSYTKVTTGFIFDPETAPNTPVSRFDNAAFSFSHNNAVTLTARNYSVNLGNMLIFGAGSSGSATPPGNAILIPNDAFTIDAKMDDGKPGTGKWIASLVGGGSPAADFNFNGTKSCSTDANGTTFTGDYKRTVREVACSFFIASEY
jgi:type II secretory pathway pseudopilin PulG